MQWDVFGMSVSTDSLLLWKSILTVDFSLQPGDECVRQSRARIDPNGPLLPAQGQSEKQKLRSAHTHIYAHTHTHRGRPGNSIIIFALFFPAVWCFVNFLRFAHVHRNTHAHERTVGKKGGGRCMCVGERERERERKRERGRSWPAEEQDWVIWFSQLHPGGVTLTAARQPNRPGWCVNPVLRCTFPLLWVPVHFHQLLTDCGH